MGITGYHSSKTAHGRERRRLCSAVMLSQEVWVSLRLCISKKLQEMQVLLLWHHGLSHKELGSQQGKGDNLGVRRVVFKKIYVKKEKM